MEDVFYIVWHDDICSTTSTPYPASYHRTRESAERFIQRERENDWEYWNIEQVFFGDD